MQWEIGQTVQVHSRTWAGINKPGGCAKITNVHRTADGNYVEGLDVKYLVGGGMDKNIDPGIVSPFETLERGGRKRRGREFLHEREADSKKQDATKNNSHNNTQSRGAKEKDSPPLTEAAAPRESGSSRQSITTYSTPQKRKLSQKTPKKVTPIPKLVKIGQKIDYISPMTDDQPPIGKRQEDPKSSVARGLFFDIAEEKGETKNKATTKPTTSRKAPPGTTTQQRQPGEENVQNGDPDKKPAAASAKPILSPSAQRTNPSSAQKSTFVVRLQTTGVAASRGVAKRPVKLSFARTESAYRASDVKMPAAACRKPLLDVYRDEVKKAREFMDEMVAPRSDNPNLGEASDNTRFIRTSSRYDEFLSTLRTVWMKVEDEEISEDNFLTLFHQLTSNSFAQEELNEHIQSLCNEGKLMKSDGILYKID